MTDFFPILVAGSGGSGGGNNTTSGLFPNGMEIVSKSRDFQSGDAGKLLFLENNVALTMPPLTPFSEHENVGIMAADSNVFFNMEPGGSLISFMSNDVNGEVVLLTNEIIDENLYLLPISTNIIDDNGVTKTALRYITDKLVDVRPYKSITLAISQSGTDDPVIEHILENGVNENFTITYDSAGQYMLEIINPLFLEYKIFCFSQCQTHALSPFIFRAARNSDTQIAIQTLLMDGTPTDSLIPSEFVFEIRIYK